MHRRKFENILYIDRKILYITLGIVLVSVFSLTIIYAALSTTLNINGNAEISSASWDIHLDNVQLNSSSATTTAPTITNSTTATFSTTLSKPGDFYEFTIDVVNEGSIDAMIDGVTKTPTLTTTQAKYLNYIVEYQNGESINTKQIVAKNSFVRLKVKLEFRKDITASDLPQTSETLNLSFTVNYVQSDENGTTIENNGIRKIYNIASGNLNTVGSEICIGEECFYLIKNDGEYVTMLAKYNLYVGNTCTSLTSCTAIENPSGIQDPSAIGSIASVDENGNPFFNPDNIEYGTIEFSSTDYWYDESIDDTNSKYPIDINYDTGHYVYDHNSTLYPYIETYKTYLESQGANIEEARLIKVSELSELGCDYTGYTCIEAPSWVYSTSYWSGTVFNYEFIYGINYFTNSTYYNFSDNTYNANYDFGIRPVIKINLSEFTQ